MVTLKFKGNTDLYSAICEALEGNRAFIENDIVVNHDKPGEIVICLGCDNPYDVEVREKDANRTILD